MSKSAGILRARGASAKLLQGAAARAKAACTRIRPWLVRGLAALLMAGAAGFPGVAAAQENKADRPGSDYRNFELEPLRAGDPPSFSDHAANDCAWACQQEGNCKAWTFVAPGVQGRNGRCWLKNAVPAAVPCPYCTSGVKDPANETNIDRPGLDIRNFADPSAQPAACQAACDQDGRCVSWTYVRPGVQGPGARCWLKNGYPAAVVNDCCTTGLQHRPSGPPAILK